MKTIKTIKKHYGKITVVALLIVWAVCIVLVMPPKNAQAKSYVATTVSLPTYNTGVLLTDPYFILYDVRTGYLCDATSGIPAVATTWANAAFDSDHWTGAAVSTITGFPNLIIPALDSKREYGIMMFDGASPANTDTCITKGLYNPSTGLPYSDSSPTKRGEVMSRTFIER